MDYKFIVKERNECVPLCNKEHLCIHIEAIHLIDGTYKFVPTHENESHDVHANLTKVIQVLDQSSEDPKAKCI